MAWTSITFAFQEVLTSAKMTNLQANFAAMAAGDAGAPTVAIAGGGTGATNASAARTALGLVIGSDVQAWDAQLDDIAALAVTNGNFIVGNGSAWVAESGATVRTSLGLGSLATLSSINNSNWSGTDLAVTNGGTGASDAATARTNLGLAIGSDVNEYMSTIGQAEAEAGTATTRRAWNALRSKQAIKALESHVLIQSVIASSDAAIEFTDLSGYDKYIVEVIRAVPATDNVQMYCRTSTDNGATYDSGASDYKEQWINASGSTVSTAAQTKAHFVAMNAVSNVAAEGGCSFKLELMKPGDAAYAHMLINGLLANSSAAPQPWINSGFRVSAADVDAIQFFFSSGNISSGIFNLYGVQ